MTETVNGVEICETRFSHPDFQIGQDMRFPSIWVRVPGAEWVRTPYRRLSVVREQCRANGLDCVETMRQVAKFKQAIMAAEKNRLNTNLQGERDELQQKILQVTAERDAARQQHLVESRKYNAEVERGLALEKQVAEMKGREELQNVYGAGQAGRIVGLEGVVESLKAERDELRAQLAKVRAQATEVRAQKAELSGNSGELPTEPAPEPYQWQVGDMIVRSGSLRSVLETCERSVRPEGWEEDEFVSQEFLEGYGWKLYRKASDLGVQQLAPRKVEISDSTGTDGEGQP